MPPSTNGTQYSNRIGVGMFVDDGGATVRYLDAVIARIRELKSLSSATSISIRNVYGQGGQQADSSRVTSRTNAAQQETREKTRQLDLFNQHDARVSNDIRRRATDTAEHIVREGRRGTDAFAQATRSLSEQLKGMTDEQFRVFAQGKGQGLGKERLTEEWQRRLGTTDPNRHFAGQPPPIVGGQSKAETDAQIAAIYARRAGDPTQQRLPLIHQRPPTSFAMGEPTAEELQAVELAHNARQARITELRERARRRVAAAPKDTFDLPPGTQRDREVYQRWNADRQRRGLPYARDLDLENGPQSLRREQEGERTAYLKEAERRRRKREAEEAQRTLDAEEAHRERQVQQAGAAAFRRGYRTPEQQSFVEERNRKEYEERQEAFRRRVNIERTRRNAEQVRQRREEEQRAAQEARDADRTQKEADHARSERQRPFREARQQREAEREGTKGTDEVFFPSTKKPTLAGARQELLNVAQAANTLTAQYNKMGAAGRANFNIRQQTQAARGNLQGVAQAAAHLYNQLNLPAGQRQPYSHILAQLHNLQAQLGQAKAQAATLNNQLLNTPGGPGGGGPGGGGPGGGGGGRGGSIYQRGLFGMGGGGTGGIVAGILTRDLIRGAIRDTEQFVKLSLQAANAETDAANQLGIAANNSGRLARENLTLAESIHRQYGVARTIADEEVSSTQRFAERAGKSGQVGQLLSALQNMAAARGIQQKNVPTFIDEAQNEQGRFAEKYLGKRVNTIYEEYAAQHKGELSEGMRESQVSLKGLAASLTDYEREQALVNEILRQSAQYHGAAAQRANSLASSGDKLSSSINDIEVSFGRFIQTNRLVVDSAEAVARVFSKLADRGEDAKPTGPGGLILSDADIEARAKAAANSWSEYLTRMAHRTSDITTAALAFLPLTTLRGRLWGRYQTSRKRLRGGGNGGLRIAAREKPLECCARVRCL
jgi:hypothetical protein